MLLISVLLVELPGKPVISAEDKACQRELQILRADFFISSRSKLVQRVFTFAHPDKVAIFCFYLSPLSNAP